MKDKNLRDYPALSPWWATDRHQDRRPFLLARNAIQSQLRSWFEDEGFIEVDPAILQRSPGNEVHLHAFKTQSQHVDGRFKSNLYLHTSPEFAMKKLIAAGETKLFAFTHAFRNREDGPTHAHEFTMLEWYRCGASLEDLMLNCEAIIEQSLKAAAQPCLHFKDLRADQAPKRISVCEAFSRFANVDLLASLNDPQKPDAQILRAQTSVRTARDDDWSDIFTRIMVEQVEPQLPQDCPVFLYDYPKPEAALAKTNPNQPKLARRFELYACGIELANAFEELTDSTEQRMRFEADMSTREAIYGERYPIDEDLLKALDHMPPTAGIALGFERLVMLSTGASRIDQVLWTPSDSA